MAGEDGGRSPRSARAGDVDDVRRRRAGASTPSTPRRSAAIPWWRRFLTGVVPPIVAVVAVHRRLAGRVGLGDPAGVQAALAGGGVRPDRGGVRQRAGALDHLDLDQPRRRSASLFARGHRDARSGLAGRDGAAGARRRSGRSSPGLQSLPSVAWVPAAVLWFGLTDGTIYFVVLMGAVPSIANGLVSGIEQVPPLLPRVGYAMGATPRAGRPADHAPGGAAGVLLGPASRVGRSRGARSWPRRSSRPRRASGSGWGPTSTRGRRSRTCPR